MPCGILWLMDFLLALWPGTEFWSRVFASLLAVVLGVPIALSLSRRGEAAIEQQRRQNARIAVAHALEVLATAIATAPTGITTKLGADRQTL